MAVADSTHCPVILYNVPGRTGVSLAATTIAELAAHPNIRIVKEATGNVGFVSEILDQLAISGRSMDILSGDDSNFLPSLAVGATGVISVASNLVPRKMVDLFNLYSSGQIEAATKAHQELYPLFRDLFVESNPAPIKAAMASIGVCENFLRLPLVPLSPAGQKILSQTLKRCRVDKGM
jgi:4-hydroxy-tetrahydrodipicolinate synthase